MTTQTQNPGMADYVALVKRRRGLMAAIAIPIIGIALLLASFLPNVYRSSALIEIENDPQRSAFMDTARPSGDEPSYADQYVSSLQGVVLTDQNLGRLLDTYKLYPGQDSDRESALARLRHDIKIDIVTVPILDPRTGREREVVTAFTVAHEARDPKNAQLVAQWLANEFLAANRNQYRQRASSAAEFYGNETERMGKHIAGLESQLADFKKANYGRLPELTEVNMNTMDRSERELDNLQMQARSLRRERVFLTSQLEQALAANPQAAGLEELEAEYQRKSTQYDASHPDLISLRRQIDAMKRGGPALGASLQSQLDTKRSILAETQQRYSPEHPDVKRLQREIASLQARIAAGEKSDAPADVNTPVAVQLKTQIAAIDSQLASMDARTGDVRQKLEQVEANVVSSPQVERNYQTLTRDLSIARTKYEELLKRQMDAQISEAAIAAGRADEFRVVQPPLLPAEPAKPKRAAIAGLGLLLAVIAALSAMVAVEFFDPTVRGARDVRTALAISPLAAIPQIRNSVSRRRQFKRSIAAAAAMAAGMFVVYYTIAQTL